MLAYALASTERAAIIGCPIFLRLKPFMRMATGALVAAPCHLDCTMFCNDIVSQVRILDMIKLLLQPGAQLAQIWSILW